MYYLDKNIENLERIFDQNERKDYLRLDLNENPGGLSKEFIDETLKDVTPQFVAQYPETLHFTEVLANHVGTDISHICITNGSAEAIRYVIQAFTSVDGRIVGVVPSYFMFQVYSEMYGRNFVKVPYNEDLSISIENIIKELTDETQMLILLNPNNPMGNVYSDEEFEVLFKVCQEKEITLLVDEAYYYFYPKTFIKYALNNRRILVTRTFSKLFAMAGCRLGYVKGIYSEDRAKAFIRQLQGVIPVIEETLKQADEVKTVANYIKMAPDAFFIGRGLDYTLSLEGALKLKEISYVHAEAYAAGELKHGTIALITENVPVIALATQESVYGKMISNIREVKARGAYVILVSMDEEYNDKDVCDKHISIPKQDGLFTVFSAAVILQLIAYYTSDAKGLDVDKPRNLAKSVTVE